jgi:hypothetical protein
MHQRSQGMLTKRGFILRTAIRIAIGFLVIGAIGWYTDRIAMSWEAHLCIDTLVIGLVIGVITMKPMTYDQYLNGG